MEQGLIGFELLCNGENGYGFDDLFVGLGHSDRCNGVKDRIDRVRLTFVKIEPSKTQIRFFKFTMGADTQARR